MSRHSTPLRWHRHRARTLGLGLLAMTALLLAPVRRDAFAQSAPPATETSAAESTASPPPLKPRPTLDLRRLIPIAGNLQAGKARADELCGICHGAAGIANAPLFPNLAPQNAEYLYWELVGYQRGAYPESPMAPLTANLTDQDLRDLAVFYAALTPSAADVAGAAGGEAPAAAEPGLVARGASLFLDGDPAKGIPPCQACHGNDARGHPLARRVDGDGHLLPYAAYPALRAQHDVYLQARLAAYRDGLLKDSTNDLIMSEVAARLDEDSIQALSAYLSSLPP